MMTPIFSLAVTTSRENRDGCTDRRIGTRLRLPWSLAIAQALSSRFLSSAIMVRICASNGI